MWKPGCGSQDLEARMWKPGCGSQDLEARIWKPRSLSENNEKALIFIRKMRCWKNNDSRTGFVNIGLENVAVVAARVVERPPRCNNKRVQKRRCLQNVCENHFSPKSYFRMKNNAFSSFSLPSLGFQILATKSWLPHPGFQMLATTS